MVVRVCVRVCVCVCVCAVRILGRGCREEARVNRRLVYGGGSNWSA
jgi:hypothetical protein